MIALQFGFLHRGWLGRSLVAMALFAIIALPTLEASHLHTENSIADSCLLCQQSGDKAPALLSTWASPIETRQVAAMPVLPAEAASAPRHLPPARAPPAHS